MSISRSSWSQLKSVTANDFIRALKKDGWVDEERRGATRCFSKDGRRIVIHYHPKKTFGDKLMKGLVRDTGWSEGDLAELKLIRKPTTKKKKL